MIKIILAIIAALFIITRGNAVLSQCDIQTARQAIPIRIFAEQTIDGKNQPILVTRFLHNKAGIFASEFGHCYFSLLDPNFLNQSLGLVGLLALAYMIYYNIYNVFFRKGKQSYHFSFLLLMLFMIFPALPFFRFPPTIVIFAYKIFAIIGLVQLVRNK